MVETRSVLKSLKGGENSQTDNQKQTSEGDVSDPHQIEVNLKNLIEGYNQQAVSNSENTCDIAEINDLLVGLSMQITKLVRNKNGTENTHGWLPKNTTIMIIPRKTINIVTLQE